MIAQFNPIVGNLEKNRQRIKELHFKAQARRVNLIAFPEMSLTGYPVQDLLLKPTFMLEVTATIAQLKLDLQGGLPVLFGAPASIAGEIYNAYYLIKDGEYSIVSLKHHF